jgi:lysyl-tRNA synthetase class 2
MLSPDTQARVMGAAVSAAGAACVASVLARWHARLHPLATLLAPQVASLAAGTVALTGLALILAGRGVARRRRLACDLASALLAVATVTHLLRGPDVLAAAVTGLLCLMLVARRPLFTATPGPARAASVLKLACALVLLDAAYGTAGLLMRARDAHPRPTAGTVAEEITARLIGQAGPLTITGRFGQWFPVSLTVLGAITLAAGVLAALAPVALRGTGTTSERDEIRRLISRPDGDTLDPFILRRDKRWCFAPDHEAAIGFRCVHGIGLASSDPVGSPAALPAAIGEFVRLCTDRGLTPAVIGARWDHVELYTRLGLRSLYIGDEAIIDVPSFTLNGRRMRNARQAASRSRNAGITTSTYREADIPPALRAQLLTIATAQHGNAPETGFSMALGDLFSGGHPDCRIIVAADRSGDAVAFQRYVTCRAGRALSLDTMRRDPAAPGGVNERMITDAVTWARDHGIGEVSLNFAAFRYLLEPEAELPAGQVMGAWLLRKMEGHFGIQMDSLRRFNAKFQPRWIPRYLIYPSRSQLPAIGLAVLSAEGFLPFDEGRAHPATPAGDATPSNSLPRAAPGKTAGSSRRFPSGATWGPGSGPAVVKGAQSPRTNAGPA